MQIRTPKRYQGVQRRRVITWRLLFYLVGILLLVSVIAIYINRQVIRLVVEDTVLNAIHDLENQTATLAAPPPTPTIDYTNRMIEGDTYWRRGALNRALNIYMEIADSFPNIPELYRRIALGFINQNRPDDALMYAEQAINADPFSSDAWAIRAWSLDWSGRPGEAISSAQRALDLDQKNSRARAYLAEAYHSLGEIDRAEDLVKATLEENPDSAEAYRARGLIKWLSRFDLEGAKQDFETAYKMTDNMHFIAVNLASVEIALGNYDSAKDLLQAVLEVDPHNQLALDQLKYIY